jgi:hypothetical protein
MTNFCFVRVTILSSESLYRALALRNGVKLILLRERISILREVAYESLKSFLSLPHNDRA